MILMDKKRSIGITIFSILFFISALSTWGRSAFYLKSLGVVWMPYARLLAVLLLILAIKILQLKEWARKGIIWYYIISPLPALFLIPKTVFSDPEVEQFRVPLMIGLYIVIILMIAVVIYFFTRPKVKEQFK